MDRKILKIMILAATMACAIPTASEAQEFISAPVTVSKEKVRVSGKVCYSHIVREKQTLFAIAKAYNVTVDDIYAFNPSLKETGLKKNSIILIPSQEALSKAEEKAEVKPEVKNEVKPEIKAEEKAEEKTEVKVEEKVEEKAEEKTAPKAPEKKKKQKTHTVKWYEDLDVIAEKYGVSVEAIMKANNLTGRKLTKRQKLIIPEPGEIIETDVPEEITEKVTEPEQPEEVPAEAADTSSVQPEQEPGWFFSPKDEVKATLILPMNASSENTSRNNMDFYSGVLMAVRDLAETGINTELNVYDSSDSSFPIAGEDIEDSDIIIGPVSSGDLNRLLDAEQKARMVISPLDPRAEAIAHTHTNFIHAPTPHFIQYQDLVNWIREDVMPGDTLLMITEKGARQTDAVVQMKQIADSSGLAFIPFTYSILEGRDITQPLTDLMTKTGTNRVMIASDSEAFVNDVVRNLNILVYNQLNVVLYAPARIRNFDTIEVENLHNTSLHVSLGYMTDYDSPQVKNFLLKYRALYNTEPTQYAFQGYDIASYFISMCSKYGNRWTRKLEDNERQMLQSTFRYAPVENGGFINNGVRRIVYGKDWSVTKVK